MKVKYFDEGSSDLAQVKFTEYSKKNCITKTVNGISYTKKGKSYAPLSNVDRILRGLAVVVLSLIILPLTFSAGRKFIKQLGKEAFYGMEKTIFYVREFPQIDQGAFINSMTSKMKKDFKDIDKFLSVTCFVKITRDDQSFIRQYIFTNKDGTSVNQSDFANTIDKINKNLSKEPFTNTNFANTIDKTNKNPSKKTTLIHSISHQWVIISELSAKKFYVSYGDGDLDCNHTMKQLQGGGCNGVHGNEGMHVAAHMFKEMGIKQEKIYKDGNIVLGPYFYDLTSKEDTLLLNL